MKLFEDAGCLSDELLRPKDMTAKFGGASLPLAVELASDEELWIEIAKFKDASHMKEVHSQVAKNPDLEKLHSRFDLLISGKQVYHAEFESLRRHQAGNGGQPMPRARSVPGQYPLTCGGFWDAAPLVQKGCTPPHPCNCRCASRASSHPYPTSEPSSA